MQQLLALALVALATLTPGITVLAALGMTRRLPRELTVALAALVGVLVASLGTALRLALHLPIEWLLVWIMAISAIAFTRARLHAGRVAAPSPAPAPPLTPPAARLISLALGIWLAAIGFIVGAQLKSDTLWHAAYARKLATQDAPSFTSLGIQAERAVLSYPIPGWHDLIALASWLTHTPPHIVFWLAPALTLPLGAIALAGAARILLGGAWTGAVAMLAYLAVAIADAAPGFWHVDTASYPGFLVTDVAIPLAIAGWLAAAWRTDRCTSRDAWLITLVAIAAVLVLHGNYIAWLGLIIIGFALAFLLAGRWPRAAYVAQLRSGALLLGATLVGLSMFLPIWSSSDHFARGSASSEAVESITERFPGTFVGSGSSERLDPTHLVGFGGLGLAALLLLPLLAPRLAARPLYLLIVGATAVLGAASQLPLAVDAIIGLGSTSVVARMHEAIPTGLALVLVMVCAMELISSMSVAARIGVGIVTTALSIGVFVALPADPAGIPTVVPLALLGLLGVLAIMAAARVLRSRPAPVELGAMRVDAAGLAIPLAIGAACVVLLVNAASSLRAEWRSWAEPAGGWAQTLPSSERTGRTPDLVADMGELLEEVPELELVAAPPRTGYFVAASAPVRVLVSNASALDPELRTPISERADALEATSACYALLPPTALGRDLASELRSRGARLSTSDVRLPGGHAWQLAARCDG